MVKINASILNCDHTRIAEAVLKAEEAGADMIHVDVMDGVYCKNLTFGPDMVRGIKRICSIPVEVHLELLDVENMARMFFDTGADRITFQLDACENPLHALRVIKEQGIECGIGIGPSYSIDRLKYVAHLCDSITLMSVEPGYGGQPFEESVYDKITETRKLLLEKGLGCEIQIDGGVNEKTAPELVKRGADTLIVGTYIFNSDDVAGQVRKLKNI